MVSAVAEAAAATEAVAEPEARRVVDEVSGWLRVFDDGSVDRTWTGPPAALPLLAPVPAHADPRDGVSLHDLPGDPNLRLYLPHVAASGLLPVLLHFHGGGFCFSHPSWLMYHHFYARLARTTPAAVVSVELPLAPEHRLPAAIDACLAALRRLRSLALSTEEAAGAKDSVPNLLRAAADFSRLFLIGDSSGGNLVHLVAAQAATGEESLLPLRVAGGIPIHPGFVRSNRSRSELELPDSVFFTLDMLDKLTALALPRGATKDHPYTCPMGEEAPSLREVPLPPLLVAVAERDLMRDTNLEYCDALRRTGKEVEVVISGGVGHSFYLNKFAVDGDPATGERTQELILAIKDFIHRH